MKVKTMIKRLQKMNPEADVRVGHYLGQEVLFVECFQKDNSVVWLETESDIDLKAELEARYNAAAEDWNDEFDFYMDLLETGITVEMVRKYMDDEIANHMQEYCEEYGLI